MASQQPFDPYNVNLSSADPAQVICFLGLGKNEYNGGLGVRISAILVVMFVSWLGILLPVLWARSSRFKVHKYVYLFARYFGAGVIIATAFIQ
jgi:solute carrier family 39 (zinc transporter), member 1/2/3